jgi:hypothetical protein
VTVGVRRERPFQALHVEHGDAQGVAVTVAGRWPATPVPRRPSVWFDRIV